MSSQAAGPVCTVGGELTSEGRESICSLMSGDELGSGVSGLTRFSPGCCASVLVLSLLWAGEKGKTTDRQKEEQVVKGTVRCSVYPLNSS